MRPAVETLPPSAGTPHKPKSEQKQVLKKIISGGQTGADQAALDVAINLAIPHGGWLPKGRRTENGPLPTRYLLQELPSFRYADRTEKNIIDSDGTLILSHGPLSGGSKLTRHLAQTHRRPVLHIDLSTAIAFQAAKQISTWIKEAGIEVLNVAGPRQSNDSRIYKAVYEVLQTAVYMTLINESMTNPSAASPRSRAGDRDDTVPQTVEHAVKSILNRLSFQEKSRIANLSETRLEALHQHLGAHIIDMFGLENENCSLLDACRRTAGNPTLPPGEAALIIIQRLWRKLQAHTHLLRLVK